MADLRVKGIQCYKLGGVFWRETKQKKGESFIEMVGNRLRETLVGYLYDLDGKKVNQTPADSGKSYDLSREKVIHAVMTFEGPGKRARRLTSGPGVKGAIDPSNRTFRVGERNLRKQKEGVDFSVPNFLRG